jgi:hypothetical protein
MPNSSTQLITAARDVLKAHGYFVDNLWHVNDVHFLCRQHDYPPLSLEDAMKVFDLANEQFDGEYGICWPQLEKALHGFMQRQEGLEIAKETENA